jgi:hypothetical protein
MNTTMDLTQVWNNLANFATKRNEAIAAHTRGEEYDEACNALLKPLVFRDHGNTFYGLQLPQCFPSMTQPDVLSILEWFVQDGTVVRPGRDLVEVRANYGDILIPMHPQLRGSYRVAQILKSLNESIQMGDLLIILQEVTPNTQKQKKSRRNAAAA